MVDSPINKHDFGESVTNIKFANIREPARGNGGAKSIVTANGAVIEEWSVEENGVLCMMQGVERVSY